MRPLFITALALLLCATSHGQSRKNMLYSSFLKFPNYDLTAGWEHAVQLTKRQYTSGRVYFVVSPGFWWTGYNFTLLNESPDPKSKFEKYELSLPLHLRFELAPNRIVLGKSPGRHDNDVAIFFDVGISLNYLLGAHLHEDFNQVAGGSFPFVFDGAMKPLTSRMAANYLTFNMGMRFNRVAFFLRAYQPFAETKYTNLSKDWGMPAGVKSFFYDKWLVDPSYKQPTVFLCLGYTL